MAPSYRYVEGSDEDTAWSLAVGVSDWRWLKRLRVLPFFGD